MDLKKISLVVILLLAVMPTHALLHESARVLLAGSLLFGVLLTGNQCYKEYVQANAAPNLLQKGKDLFNQNVRRLNNENSVQDVQATVQQFAQKYGATLCWGLVTVALAITSVKLLYECING